MGLFKRTPKETIAAPLPSDVEVIRGKLALCRDEITAAETRLRQTALTAVLSDDQSAFEPVAQLQALRSRKEILEAALQAAIAAEQDRLAALRSKEEMARRRAAAQHAARLERASRNVSEAEANLLSEFGKLTEAAAALVAVLPSHMKTNAEGWQDHLGPAALRTMALMEGYRLARQQRTSFFERPAGASALERPADGSLPTLSDRISALTSQCRTSFDKSIVPAVPKGADKPLPETEHLTDAPRQVVRRLRSLMTGLPPSPVIAARLLSGLQVFL